MLLLNIAKVSNNLIICSTKKSHAKSKTKSIEVDTSMNVCFFFCFFFSVLFPLLGIVLQHQQEIERMSSFREQLGEDWLRYEHHLDGASPLTLTTTVNQQTSCSQTLSNGLTTTIATTTTSIPQQQPLPPSSHKVPEVLPPPILSSEPRNEASDVDADLEMESTLQGGQTPQLTESTLDNSMLDGLVMSQGVVSSPQPSPESHRSARAASGETNHEEEEDLGGREVEN